MSERIPYEYAIIRVVPDVARGESVNVGVLLYAQRATFLAAAVHLDEARLLALHPGLDLEAVAASVRAMADCSTRPGESPGQRFRWLTMPRSTVVQTSPIHTGLAADPAAELPRLLARLVPGATNGNGGHSEE